MTTEVFEDDDILVGWHSTTINAKGKEVLAFIPRRDEDIESDRKAISQLLNKAKKR